jgi:hypothetical protein
VGMAQERCVEMLPGLRSPACLGELPPPGEGPRGRPGLRDPEGPGIRSGRSLGRDQRSEEDQGEEAGQGLA